MLPAGDGRPRARHPGMGRGQGFRRSLFSDGRGRFGLELMFVGTGGA
jgi:hypothetical protein